MIKAKQIIWGKKTVYPSGVTVWHGGTKELPEIAEIRLTKDNGYQCRIIGQSAYPDSLLASKKWCQDTLNTFIQSIAEESL